MRILWAATKAPVPAGDGGRLVALTTLRALAAAGHELTVVAPIAPEAAADTRRAAGAAGFTLELVPAVPRPWPLAAAVGLVRGLPFTITRHGHAALRARVDRLLATHVYDVIHAEQVQAMPACGGASARGVPVVLRAQNVESDLWQARAERTPLLRTEVARLARFEGAAVRRAAATIALTARDAARLAALAGDAARVRHVRAPFPADGLAAGPPLPGDPAIVIAGSTGWPPNDEAAAWFTQAVWPLVAAALPSARLHVFGSRPALTTDTITLHAPPPDSAEIFAAGAVVVVPLLTAVGVRMRILEAWARGLPVVATPAAIAGLDAGVEQAVAVGRSAEEIASTLAALAADPARRQALVAAGAALLRARHDPATIAGEMAAVYASVAGSVTSADRARS